MNSGKRKVDLDSCDGSDNLFFFARLFAYIFTAGNDKNDMSEIREMN